MTAAAATSAAHARAAAIVRHTRAGRRHGYPACCIAHFCWDQLMGWPAGVTRWRQLQPTTASRDRHVVCGVWHAGASRYPLHVRLGRIICYQLLRIPLTAGGRRRRSIAIRGSSRWERATSEEKVTASKFGRLAALYWDDDNSRG